MNVEDFLYQMLPSIRKDLPWKSSKTPSKRNDANHPSSSSTQTLAKHVLERCSIVASTRAMHGPKSMDALSLT